jgi:iron complex outermembrane receptor protein
MKGLKQQAGKALLLAATAFCVPGVYPSVAAAQTAEEPAAIAPDAVGEVVVTARGRGERVQNVPFAITAITAQLENADLRDLRDVVAFTPNVRIEDINLRPGAPSVNIRGISPSRTDDNTIDSPIGVLIDGIYLGSLPGQIVDNFDVERIEVLRGPQGTLFGRNTIGGALNVIRTEPTGEWGGRFQYTTGSFDDQEFRLVLNTPSLDGVLAAKFYYFSAERDGFLKNTFQHSTNPQRDYENYGVTLLFTPNDTWKSLLTVEHFNDRSQSGGGLGNYNVVPGVLPPPSTPSDFNQPDGSLAGGLTIDTFLPGLFGLTNLPPRTNLALPDTTTVDFSPSGSVQTTAYTWNNKWQINPHLQFVSVTGYRDQTEYNARDFDGTSAPFINIITDADYSQFTQEFRFEGDWDTPVGPVTAVAGLYYFESSFTRNWITSGEFWNFVGLLSGFNLANNTWLNPALAVSTGFATPIQACIAPRTPATTAVFGRTRCDPTVTTAYGPAFPAKLFEAQDTESLAVFAHATGSSRRDGRGRWARATLASPRTSRATKPM